MMLAFYAFGIILGFTLVGLTDWFGLKDRTSDPLRDDDFSIRRRDRENEHTEMFVSVGILFWPVVMPLVAMCWMGHLVARGAIRIGSLLRHKLKSEEWKDYDD